MKIQIFLNSYYATKKINGTKNSDLLFYFTSPIIPPSGQNMTIKLLNFSLPVSFTNINSSNNTMVVGTSTYTLTTGNYTASTLRTHLQSVLGSGWTVSYDSTQNKYTFSSSSSFTFKSSSTCLKVLGFATTSDTSSSGTSLTSTYQIDLSGDNTIYYDIANLKTNNLSSSVGAQTSILRSVLNNVTNGSVLYYEDQSDLSATISEDHISFLHIRLYGEDATTLLDLNNSDWQSTIEIGFEDKQQQPTLARSFQDFYQQYIKQLDGN